MTRCCSIFEALFKDIAVATASEVPSEDTSSLRMFAAVDCCSADWSLVVELVSFEELAEGVGIGFDEVSVGGVEVADAVDSVWSS